MEYDEDKPSVAPNSEILVSESRIPYVSKRIFGHILGVSYLIMLKCINHAYI